MKIDACPNRDLLSSHLLGKLYGGMADAVDEHLASCESCVQVAREIDAEDELTRAFRAGMPQFEGDPDEVGKVIERGKQLRSQAETVETDETIITDRAGQAENAPDASADSDETNVDEEIDFLTPAEEADEIGRLGDYRVLEVLGIGGMGVVFRAEDPKLKRQVALKAMKPAVAASKSARDRFVREAQATAAIEHDNIVHIYQVGEDRNIPYIAMQFLRGESLQKRLEREKQLNQREVLRIGREVAAGLEAAHKRELVHRDIKPDNIWIEEETGRAKILDFGLVRASTDDAGLTQSGMVLGTPRYMAPEQAQGRTVDHRCDLFSLGSVLYHLATGRAPFEGGNLTATLIAVAQKDPDPIEQVCPEIEPDLSQLIMRLLSKDRDRRPQSAADVSKAIADIEQKLAVEEAEKTRQRQVAKTALLSQSPIAKAEPKTQPKSRTPIFFGGAIVAIAMVVFGWLCFTGVILKFETEDGTLIVNVTGDDFATSINGLKVTIKNTETDETVTIDLKSPNESKLLKPGSYFVLETDSGLTTETTHFTIRSGKEQVVEVSWEPKHQVAEAAAGTTPPLAMAKNDTPSIGSFSAGENWALAFVGKNSGGVIFGDWKLDGSHPLTYEARVRPATVIAPSPRTGYILGWPGGSSLLHGDNTGNVRNAPFTADKYAVHWQKQSGGFSTLISDKQVTTDASVSIAVVWDGATVVLFVDGTKQNSSIAAKSGSVSGKRLAIGYARFSRMPSFLGIIDEFRISKTARYDKDFTPVKRFETDENTLALYHFDEGNGDVLKDSSGNGHHGTIVAAKWVRVDDQLNVIDTAKLKPARPTVTDPDRAAAEYVVSVGGKLMTDRGDEWTDVVPEGPFRLKGVGLYRRDVIDEGLAVFSGCTEIESLDLSWTGVTDAGVIHFKDCNNLTELKLGTMVTNKGLAHFQDCDRLERLTLICSTHNITDAGLAFFKNCKELNFLYLHHANVGDAGLAQLKNCRKLAFLHLDRSNVTDDGMALLKEWPELHSLGLVFSQVGDAGMAHLKDCPVLTSLHFVATNITDVGVAHLKECKGLTSVLIARTRDVTSPIVKELKEALPKCNVDWRPASLPEPSDRLPSLQELNHAR